MKFIDTKNTRTIRIAGIENCKFILAQKSRKKALVNFQLIDPLSRTTAKNCEYYNDLWIKL